MTKHFYSAYLFLHTLLSVLHINVFNPHNDFRMQSSSYYCYIKKYHKTQWLKTITIIYFACESTMWAGFIRNGSSLLHAGSTEVRESTSKISQLHSCRVDDYQWFFFLGQLGFPHSMVAGFQKQVSQETGSGSCQFLKAWDLETDKISLPTYSIGQAKHRIYLQGEEIQTSPLHGSSAKEFGDMF